LTWISNKTVDSILIVTKKALIRNWEEEITRHSHLRAKILDQDPKTIFFALNAPARIYLTHYEVCIAAESILSLFLKTRDVAIICDESQKFKNPDSSLASSMFKLAPGFKRRVIMTGTPIANRPYDIWSQIYFLDHGESLGDNYDQFKTDLDLPDNDQDRDAHYLFKHALSDVYSRIKRFSVRETKLSCGIELPTKEVENVPVSFAKEQQRLYDKYRDEIQVDVYKNGRLVTDNAEAILKRLLRLVQIASNPILVDESYSEIPAKFKVLLGIIDKQTSDNSKVIVWTSFTENADWLYKSLKHYSPVKVHGRIAIEERNASIKRFKEDSSCKIFIATPGAAKEGLTLTVSNCAVFYDRSFSLDDYLQSQDRIHRISQKDTCYIYNLIMKDSIDEWVDELLTAKHIAAQYGQGDISEDQFSERMSYDFTSMLRTVLNIHN